MSNKRKSKENYFGNTQKITQPNPQVRVSQPKIVDSLLDSMVEGKEYSSIVPLILKGDLMEELKKSICEIEKIRNRKVICYLANMTNLSIAQQAPIGIDSSDDLPMSELINSIDSSDNKNIDIILVTPGGSLEKIIYYNSLIRNKFENVSFILPYMAMSAGTVFCMSGEEIIMGERACIGPIDPQVLSKNGTYLPAQSIISLIESIRVKGEEAIAMGKKIAWTDIQILSNLDPKEIGNAYFASGLAINTTKDFLIKYKFKNWKFHEKTNTPVTSEEKAEAAINIANNLCNHSNWNSHGSPITREVARNKCSLKIIDAESVGLKSALDRFWALTTYIFERTPAAKIYISNTYGVVRSATLININKEGAK